jgi:alkylation response protein AidB-like acyl-CoA dehydrogenase
MIDLSLSEDQIQTVEAVVSLLDEHSPVSRLRPGEANRDAHLKLAAWGWFGVGVPEDRNGLGLGVVEEALLHFEAGRYLLSPSVLATTLAARLCPADLSADLLMGKTRAALALADDDSAFVFDGDKAALLIVLDRDEIWLAPAAAFSGETVTGLDEALVTEKGMLDRAMRLAAEPADRSRLLASSMLAGIAAASSDLAVSYAKVREQFGQPIGAFQAIKHICANMGLRAYAAEAQVKMAAATAAYSPAMAAFQIDAAALAALRAARANSEDAIQVHGGIGFTVECEAHFYLKRAHVLGRILGGLDMCRARVVASPSLGVI